MLASPPHPGQALAFRLRPSPQPAWPLLAPLGLGLLAAWLACLGATAPAGAEEPPTFVRRWARQGSAPGLVEYPRSIDVDSLGRIYVADSRNHRIQRFERDGTFLDMWGSQGNAPGQFDTPNGIAVERGFVYVADTGNRRIQKFTLPGSFRTAWGSEGFGPGEFQGPFAVAVDPQGAVYVLDSTRGDVQKFDPNGTFLQRWGSDFAGDGTFHLALGITATATSVYVTEVGFMGEPGCQCVHQFTPRGVFVRRWGGHGDLPGRFVTPLGVATDPWGNVYVADHHNFRLQKFSADGTFLAVWGRRGTAPGEFIDPHDLTVDRQGDLFVIDFGDDGMVMHWSYGPTAVGRANWSDVKALFRAPRRP